MPIIEDIAVGSAGNVTATAIIEIVKYVKTVAGSEKNLQFLVTDLARMENILSDVRNQFEDEQKTLPTLLQDCLGSIKNALQEVTDLIACAKQHRRRCLGCCFFCHPKLPAQISEWRRTRFNELFQQLESALSISASTAQIVESAPPRAEVLLQPLPESGFVGSGIAESAQQVLTWLNEPHPHARVIGVYGMAGVGKTALLQLIHNKCKEKVSSNFDYVIWFTVSQTFKVESLQVSIAKVLNLMFEEGESIDYRKMKLYASLENKSFLLLLDDMWSPIVDLNQVGVNFGHDNRSRVLISSRFRDVVETFAVKKYCMMIRPLSSEEGWELFSRRAFTNGALIPEHIAKEVASECQGLPLAINVVAAAMAPKETADEWSRALHLMRNVDPSFPSTHRTIDKELYQRLRLSYDDLPHNLKMCFLYCAAFPEDALIHVETLVEMWTAESLVPQKGRTYFMDVGREYIHTLVHRCFIEYDDRDAEKKLIKVHDVLRDMGIYIGQGDEEKWLFLASQHLKNFPSKEETRDCKRISLMDNEITDLPAADLKCPTLVSLMLARNTELNEISEGFLVNFMSLKVLDLSYTSIKALPASVGQLGQLEFLNLKSCWSLKDLPDSICNLSHLQFLNLEECGSLNSLPDRIGELKNLKHLQVSLFQGYGEFKVIPHQISQLTSLNKLVLPSTLSTPMTAEDLSSLSNLIELDVYVKPEIKGGSMSTWSEMRELTLNFWGSEDENRDDAALDILPQNMQSMRKLQHLCLYHYLGVSLPNCICQFQNLKMLKLLYCRKLKELPALANGSACFPMLESLDLDSLESLESIVWNEGTMLKLQCLMITGCEVLETFRTEELPNLRYVFIQCCVKLKELFIRSDGFPMLELLALRDLPELENVAIPSSVWSEETMPKLQVLRIRDCLLLRRLSMEKLPNLKEIKISHCPELELEIGNLLMLETLTLKGLEKLESIARPSGVWNESTMPKLQHLRIRDCSSLRRLPPEMDKLPNLKEIVGKIDWWQGIIWEDHNVKIKLSQLFKEEEEEKKEEEEEEFIINIM